jgi:UDP-glucuronate 4-epimerase
MVFLVTGGAGFIGSHLTARLLESGYTVVCLDNFDEFYSPRIKRRNISPFISNDSYSLVEGDIRDTALLEELSSKYRFDHVVHLAAKAGVRPSIQDPFIYEDVNIRGTLCLLECFKDKNLKRFVFASSSSVYGNRNKVPFSEEDRVDAPVSPYGATKKAGEIFCYNYHNLYKIPMDGEEVPVFGSGTSKRDYTYIEDIVDGIVRSLNLDSRFEIFNLGCSRTINIKYLIEVIEKNIEKKAKLNFFEAQPGDAEVTFADIHKAETLLDFKPGTTLEDGIEHFVSWYIDAKEDLC